MNLKNTLKQIASAEDAITVHPPINMLWQLPPKELAALVSKQVRAAQRAAYNWRALGAMNRRRKHDE